ncbi:hypothetical protein I3760_09G094300 [Carya illinoinensis]|nr:hypothetical protein I3760_09G094300 [Carya illinoinensis]
MENLDSHTPPNSPTHSDLHNPLSRYLNLADPTNPYRLDHGDSPSIILVADLLTTENYTTWSCAMMHALRAKNKIDHDSVSIYYGNLKTLWDEMAIYDPLSTCTCGAMKALLDRSQRDCVFQFLMGLNNSYSPIRDQIMLLDPLPPVSKIFSLYSNKSATTKSPLTHNPLKH